jgi:hypothetical protein
MRQVESKSASDALGRGEKTCSVLQVIATNKETVQHSAVLTTKQQIKLDMKYERLTEAAMHTNLYNCAILSDQESGSAKRTGGGCQLQAYTDKSA